jgi:hypothetical protein
MRAYKALKQREYRARKKLAAEVGRHDKAGKREPANVAEQATSTAIPASTSAHDASKPRGRVGAANARSRGPKSKERP